MTVATRTKPQIATMNAVHDLPVLVARDEGYFKDEGLDLEFVTTPGMAQVTTSHFVKFDSVLRPPARFGLQRRRHRPVPPCGEWGIMKRAVEANAQGLRQRKIVALGASMSKFAIVVNPHSMIYEPEMPQGQADRGDAEQRLGVHHAEDDGGLPRARACQANQRRLDAQEIGSGARRQSRRREPDGALDQRRAEVGHAHPH